LLEIVSFELVEEKCCSVAVGLVLIGKSLGQEKAGETCLSAVSLNITSLLSGSQTFFFLGMILAKSYYVQKHFLFKGVGSSPQP
jgi:hypothetical protein